MEEDCHGGSWRKIAMEEDRGRMPWGKVEERWREVAEGDGGRGESSGTVLGPG